MVKRPVIILALLTGLNLFNYLDRFVVAAVLPRVKEELLLSKTEAGFLATVFLLSYFIASPIFGALADRGRRTPLLAIGVAIWSIATVASGFADGKLSLYLARAMVGVGEASYATIAPTIIDDIAPTEKKGRWLSIFFSAVPIGSALGYIVGGAVAQDHGWRAAFFVAGGPGLVLALSCLAIVEPKRVLAKGRESILKVAGELVPIFLFRRAVLGYCAQTAALGAFAHWAPFFLDEVHGMPLKRGTFLFGTITVVAGALGTAIGGRLGDRASKRDWGETDPDRSAARGFLRVSAWSSICAAPFAFLCFFAENTLGFFIAIFLCELCLFIASSPINAAILRSVPPARRASAMALTIFLIHLLGDLWSPPAVGRLAESFGMRLGMMILPLAIAVSAVFWWLTNAKAPIAAVAGTAAPDRSS